MRNAVALVSVAIMLTSVVTMLSTAATGVTVDDERMGAVSTACAQRGQPCSRQRCAIRVKSIGRATSDGGGDAIDQRLLGERLLLVD